jgi:hypothetical protein
MRPVCFIVLVLVAPTGCKHLMHDDGHCETVTAPQQKVVVETPAAAPAPQAAPLAPAAYPTMMAAPMPLAAPTMATVQERTGLGFALDWIKIPIPCIKFIPVPRPSEVTFQIPPAQGYPMGYPMPVGYPMGYPMPAGYPVAGAPPMMAPAPQANPAAQCQLTPQQMAMLAQVLNGQSAEPPPAPGTKVSEQQLDELIKKVNALKALKQQTESAGMTGSVGPRPTPPSLGPTSGPPPTPLTVPESR